MSIKKQSEFGFGQCQYLLVNNPDSTSMAFLNCGKVSGHTGCHKAGWTGSTKGWWVRGDIEYQDKDE